MHVERTFVERRTRALPDNRLVGLLRRLVGSQGKQEFAAPELRLVAIGGVGISRHQLIQHAQRLWQVATLLMRLGQLVQHTVIAGIVRVRAQQVLIPLDGVTIIGRTRGAIGRFRLDAGLRCRCIGTRELSFIGALHLQIAQAAHRFRA